MTRIALITILCLIAATASAAEIELRAQAQASGGVVKLADVATVTGHDAQAIASLELVPGPSAGRTRSCRD